MHTESDQTKILQRLGETFMAIESTEIEQMVTAISTASRIFVVGKGRTGLQMRGFAMRLMHLGLTVHALDEVTTPSLQPEDLLLIGSGSGRTPSLLSYANKAATIGATLGVMTGNRESPIVEKATHLIYIPASNSKAGKPVDNRTILPMGSLFEHTLGLLCDLLVIKLMGSLSVSEKEMEKRHANLE